MRSISRLVAFALCAGLALSAPGLVPTAAPAPCATPHPIPINFVFEPSFPCSAQAVKLWAGGCRECVTLLGARLTGSNSVVVHCEAPERCPDLATCTSESLAVDLGRFAPGDHEIAVTIEARIVLASGDTCTATEQRSLTLHVGTECPPSSNLPYVDSIQIGPTGPCSGCTPGAICDRRPIPVTLAGHLPADCFTIREVKVQDIRLSPLPAAAIVTVVVGRDVCQIRRCIEYPIPWSSTVEIHGLPPGDYRLPVRVEQVAVACDNSTTPEGAWGSLEPFTVTDSCAAVRESCFVSSWDHAGRQGQCDAFVGPDHSADVTLQVSTPVALAGLQGRIALWPTGGLHVTALTPVGPAAGMHISWQATAEGARFVMFADQGAPIPPKPDDVLIDPVSVLRVTVSAAAGSAIPATTRVDAADLLGSDDHGVSVRECPIIYMRPIADPAAIVCGATPCDYNADNLTDVRDLVLMAHCVLQSGYCPDGAAAHLDCNQDGQVGIDDVLCCARVYLRGPQGPNAPGRPEPGIRVTFRDPSVGAGRLDLPVRVEGTERIGAARLAIRFPSDRFDVSAVDLPGGASNWLCLHEGDGDQLTLGLICLGAGPAGPLDLTLRLALKAGQTPGGEVRVERAEFAGPDGAALEVGLGAPAYGFDGPAGPALSAGVPNPFSRETGLQLTLARAATVEVTVHDLGGRLIATLHRGALAAGSHPLVWKGTRGDGSTAASGIYIVRAKSGGETATRKLVFLRGS